MHSTKYYSTAFKLTKEHRKFDLKGGAHGTDIEGHPQFLQMLKDIEAGKDKVEFVLVFKLSRFGRNAADVLSSLQRMQDFGVNLICVEDGIDSSKDSGKWRTFDCRR